VRSITLEPMAFSRLRCWVGVRSWSKMTASALAEWSAAAISSTFPRPTSVAASGAARDCTIRSTICALALAASSASSSSDSAARSTLERRGLPRVFHSSPTRMTRSRTALASGVLLTLRGVLVHRRYRSAGHGTRLGGQLRTGSIGVRHLLSNHRGNGVLEN
jgi:hypothetical protein